MVNSRSFRHGGAAKLRAIFVVMPFSPFEPDRPEPGAAASGKFRCARWCRTSSRLLALCAGLTAIRLGVEGKLEWAVAAIVFAALLDGIDGRVARMLKGTSRFGAELDSLADFVNFGVAPALILYFWGLHELGQCRLDRRHGVCDLRPGCGSRASTS